MEISAVRLLQSGFLCERF